MLDLRFALTAIALGAAMALAGLIGWRQRVGQLLLVLLSGVWLSIDHDFEGPLIVSITTDHGLVTSDLVGLAGLAVAAWEWWRTRR